MSVDMSMLLGKSYNDAEHAEPEIKVNDRGTFVTVEVDELSVFVDKGDDGAEIARRLAFAFNTAAEMCDEKVSA